MARRLPHCSPRVPLCRAWLATSPFQLNEPLSSPWLLHLGTKVIAGWNNSHDQTLGGGGDWVVVIDRRAFISFSSDGNSTVERFSFAKGHLLQNWLKALSSTNLKFLHLKKILYSRKLKIHICLRLSHSSLHLKLIGRLSESLPLSRVKVNFLCLLTVV